MSILTQRGVFTIKRFLKPKYYSQVQPSVQNKLPITPAYVHLHDVLSSNLEESEKFLKGIIVHNEFINDDEEQSILEELHPYLKRMRYEFDHWDNAIHGYRETERLDWNERNKAIIQRVRDLAMPNSTPQPTVHVLDLDKKGYIKPHIDAIRFCGDTIAGLSLLTDSVMRFVHETKKEFVADVLLKRRSLYILTHHPRYLYTHEILKNEDSLYKGEKIEKDRRISVICRDEPRPENKSL